MGKRTKKVEQFFFTLSGEDRRMISASAFEDRTKFALIGVFVMFIFIGCSCSGIFFVRQLLDNTNKWLSLPIGIFWALFVCNLYLLLLYTISPTLLPISHKKRKRKKVGNIVTRKDGTSYKTKTLINASLLLRIGFIFLLATLIAQPLNVAILDNQCQTSLKAYKVEYLTKVIISTDSILINEERRIANSARKDYQGTSADSKFFSEKVHADEQFLATAQVLLDSLGFWKKSGNNVSRFSIDSTTQVLSAALSEYLQSDLRTIEKVNNSTETFYRVKMKQIISEKLKQNARIIDIIEKSSFYIKRIKLLFSDHPLSWLISFSVCTLFFLPVFWKLKIEGESEFYIIKKEMEEVLVRRRYAEFKTRYASMFSLTLEQYNKDIYHRLNPLLVKLESINFEKGEQLRSKLRSELANAKVEKYEHWVDAPFRTQEPKKPQSLTESELLKKFYSQV